MRWIDHAIEQATHDSLLRIPLSLRFENATHAWLDERLLTVFCGNDYLGLRFDPRVIAASARAAQTHGTGAGSSRLVSGHTDLHEAAEAALAELVRRPAALLTASGFAANAGAIPALTGPEDVIFSDALNHASIVDGCRLSRARTVIYPHGDLDALRLAIARQRPFRRGWVITESLFSMDGDVCPIAQLHQLCQHEGLYLYLDEAHALGTLGPQGAGAAADTGITPDVLIGTLGKSLGSAGAFIAGEHPLRLYLWNHCRSFVFSTGVTPPSVAAALEAARIIRDDERLRNALHTNVARLRKGLAAKGFAVGGDSRAPIVPIIVGDNGRALALSQRLKTEGFFVQAIRPPTVPPNTARLRITVSAAHTLDEIDALVDALSRLA